MPDMFSWRIAAHHPAVATVRRNSKIWFIRTEFTARASFDEAKLHGRNWRNDRVRALATTTSDSTDVVQDSTGRKAEIYTLIDTIHQHEDELAELLDDLLPSNYLDYIVDTRSWGMDDVFSGTIGHRNYESLENKVRGARQQFGEYLPEDHLNEAELELYNRLYGEAIMRPAESEAVIDEREPDILLRDDGEGGFEEIDVPPENGLEEEEEEISVAYETEGILDEDEDSSAFDRAKQVAERLGGVLLESGAEIAEEEESESGPRLHPLTEAGKYSTNPRTVFLPRDSVTGPISVILSNYSNRHIAEAAYKIFGGRRLPHSTTTLPPSAQIAQVPIPLSASQHQMSDMEANAYLAALYPGIYASTLSVLVEVRKRLGGKWLRDLMAQESGPRVLDAGGSGAGILAWRDVLRAEYETMVPDHPKDAPIPTGKSTVLSGSDALQSRASVLLDNTTFLPRLPDYVHVRDSSTLDDDRAPPKRKQFDVIIAPHTLLEIDEDYMRKQHVKNLWTMLNPNGGVLILLEKGRQKGFEAIAGAREMLLEKHISSSGSTEYESLTESGDQGSIQKEAGMIIAPCTNHGKCPMYHIHGHAKGRSDYCHFEQRYIRPPFLQRIIGAKDRNHEDVEFSYVAVQRGVDLRQTESVVQGKAATDAAFEGYEDSISTSEDGETGPPSTSTVNPLSLPRTVLPPMKRRGHVIFDFCTPEGKIERWTVPRSFSRQAYHDARKARWGDLWALGAKTRVPRNLKLGSAASAESKKERLQRRAASKMAGMDGEEQEAAFNMMEASEERKVAPALADALENQARSLERRKKGHNIPSWKRHADKKRIRQAVRKVSSNTAGEDFI
ncbi:37S ribosomal protein Rsm22 [Talaromyces stipitatus ATCC 10500]|uniref:37S ribosomal protein Rsm22 n=1 Tax=Talaromyces stipitatus (strain ATCC 10500 / CBS 375.48 / QM 6759 / NRRL 1006) TaxID=441959 RepID=B8M6Y2_TALSN|nr:37S ribosomal protein Rsm22 [Talaromyces stipitatus ATCC 10500]EED20202.1 37S ribosomal protein Rsm22 [Talaromyces stipitatus ATCC 10500]